MQAAGARVETYWTDGLSFECCVFFLLLSLFFFSSPKSFPFDFSEVPRHGRLGLGLGHVPRALRRRRRGHERAHRAARIAASRSPPSFQRTRAGTTLEQCSFPPRVANERDASGCVCASWSSSSSYGKRDFSAVQEEYHRERRRASFRQTRRLMPPCAWATLTSLPIGAWCRRLDRPEDPWGVIVSFFGVPAGGGADYALTLSCLENVQVSVRALSRRVLVALLQKRRRNNTHTSHLPRAYAERRGDAVVFSHDETTDHVRDHVRSKDAFA